MKNISSSAPACVRAPHPKIDKRAAVTNAKASDVYQIVIHIEKIFKEVYNINIRREVVVLGSFI